jgi:hypothetical protein
VTAETISEAISGREFGAMTRCPGHERLSPTVRPQRRESGCQTNFDLGVAPIVAAASDWKPDGVTPTRTMKLSAKKHFRRRRYPVNLIKLSCSYEPAEIAKLFGIHRNTVRHWLKEGLIPIDDRRPILVGGLALRAFITGRQRARKRKCASGEFFCFRCRVPRKPWGGMADFSSINDKIVRAIAFCGVCETAMHRMIRRADLSKFVADLSPQTLPSTRLADRPDANANCDFEKDKRDVKTEPVK